MQCPNCNCEVNDGNKFCPACGQALVSAERVSQDEDGQAEQAESDVVETSMPDMPPFAPAVQVEQPLQAQVYEHTARSPQLMPVKTRPQGRGLLIASGILLILTALIVAVVVLLADFFGFRYVFWAASYHSGTQYYDFYLSPYFMLVVSAALLIFGVLTLIFCNMRKLGIVVLIIGVLTAAIGIIFAYITLLLQFNELWNGDVRSLSVFSTIVVAFSFMIICGAVLNLMKPKEVVPLVDDEGMIENRKPKGKALLVTGGSLLLFMFFVTLIVGNFMNIGVVGELIWLWGFRDGYIYSSEMFASPVFRIGFYIINYAALFFFLTAILATARSSSRSSGIVLTIFGVITFLILLAEIVLTIIGSIYTSTIVLLSILVVSLIGALLIIIGGMRNAVSPKRVLAPKPQPQAAPTPMPTGYVVTTYQAYPVAGNTATGNYVQSAPGSAPGAVYPSQVVPVVAYPIQGVPGSTYPGAAPGYAVSTTSPVAPPQTSPRADGTNADTSSKQEGA